MFKFFKEWYESHLTDPNQVALALIIISITLITYILLSTVVPILVAIILAYMLDGLVVTVTDKYKIKRSSSVLVVYSSFIAVSLATVLVLVPLMLNQISLFIKSLPRMLERVKNYYIQVLTLIALSHLSKVLILFQQLMLRLAVLDHRLYPTHYHQQVV